MYREKYALGLSIRSAMADYKVEDRLINLPLYAIVKLYRIIESD